MEREEEMEKYENEELTTHAKNIKNQKEEISRKEYKDISQLRRSVAMRKNTLRKNVPRRNNGRMI